MKFGKQIQKRQLEVPEFAASFVNYKALKKLIKKLSATPTLLPQDISNGSSSNSAAQSALQANKAKFFFQLERELEKVNACYLQKEAELQIRLKTLRDKKNIFQTSDQHSVRGRRSNRFNNLEEGFQAFSNDLNKLQQFVEINGTAFAKILKKWDKTSKSKTRELYLSRAVEVAPFFNATVISELSDQATTSLQELGAWSEGVHVDFDRPEHVVSTQHLLGTDEGDADTLLLDTVLSGNPDALRDLLVRMANAATSDPEGDKEHVLRERITRTFLAAINEGQEAALKALLNTGMVDIQSEDDINERNCLHQSTIYGNTFVFSQGMNTKVAVNRTDVYGRTPLHYACMHGRLDMVAKLIDANASTINLIDHDNFTPLIHAIKQNHLDCVAMLLERNARFDAFSDNDHAPLNLACERGYLEIVELLLTRGAKIMPDAEGLFPQHLVARSGQSPQLLLLLQSHGANLDQLDKLYSWSPLFHAASEGHVECLQTLLNEGVRADILDEKELSALYYASFEGHLECIRLLSAINIQTSTVHMKDGVQQAPPPMLGSMSSSAPMPMSMDLDGIPDLCLPPPIIPLRRYGHNFLDTKTFVQINFDDGDAAPMTFFHNSKYPASRLTISSKVTDVIPKNIILPFQEDTRQVSFHTDSLDSFALDIDIFPTYGAKVIAKAVALPSFFKAMQSSSGHCCLPLWDPRLRAIGQLSFDFHVIKPFAGKPLEMTDFDTYWKSTSQNEHAPNAFVTGSSLVGDYIQLFVQHTCDGIPVLWPRWTMDFMGIEFPISRLTYAQFISAGSRHAAKIADLSTITSMPFEAIAEIHLALASSAISLEDALHILPPGMHVALQIIYPSPTEEQALRLGPVANVNVFVDSILDVVFRHARHIRETSPSMMRSVVFTSYNPTICTALNWKQPNFPVFICNDLGREGEVEYNGVGSDPGSTKGDVVVSSGRRTTSVKEAIRIAKENNLMGIIGCSRLLDLVPALIGAIKTQGLILIIDKSMDTSATVSSTSSHANSFPRMAEGIDGIMKTSGVLRFNESIDM